MPVNMDLITRKPLVFWPTSMRRGCNNGAKEIMNTKHGPFADQKMVSGNLTRLQRLSTRANWHGSWRLHLLTIWCCLVSFNCMRKWRTTPSKCQRAHSQDGPGDPFCPNTRPKLKSHNRHGRAFQWVPKCWLPSRYKGKWGGKPAEKSLWHSLLTNRVHRESQGVEIPFWYTIAAGRDKHGISGLHLEWGSFERCKTQDRHAEPLPCTS